MRLELLSLLARTYTAPPFSWLSAREVASPPGRLGPLGQRVQCDRLARKLGVAVAAVDPAFGGKRLPEIVAGAEDVPVRASLEEIEDWESIDVAIVTTSSDLRVCAPTFRALLE